MTKFFAISTIIAAMFGITGVGTATAADDTKSAGVIEIATFSGSIG